MSLNPTNTSTITINEVAKSQGISRFELSSNNAAVASVSAPFFNPVSRQFQGTVTGVSNGTTQIVARAYMRRYDGSELLVCSDTSTTSVTTPAPPPVCQNNGICMTTSCCTGTNYADATCGSGVRCGAAPPPPPPPGCTIDGACKAALSVCCTATSYADATCGTGIRCGVAPPPPPTPCTVSLGGNFIMNMADPPRNVGVTISPAGGVARITSLTSTAPAVATVTPPNGNAPLIAQVNAVGIGSTTLQALATRDGVTCTPTPGTINVTVDAPNAWWQVGRGNVFSGGDLRSEIPIADSLILDDPTSGDPGVAIYGPSTPPYSYSFDFAAGAPTGQVSSRNWLSSTATSTNIYKYAYFESLASGKTFDVLFDGTRITNGDISGGGRPGDSYRYIKVFDDAVIDNPLNFNGNNKRAVVFVEGDLTITRDIIISVNKIDNNFLMFIVKGKIIIDPQVAEIKGIFVTNGNFNTGGGSVQLEVTGSVAADSMTLGRDLQAGNASAPAELFTYSPELIINYPPALSERHLVWREVAP